MIILQFKKGNHILFKLYFPIIKKKLSCIALLTTSILHVPPCNSPHFTKKCNMFPLHPNWQECHPSFMLHIEFHTLQTNTDSPKCLRAPPLPSSTFCLSFPDNTLLLMHANEQSARSQSVSLCFTVHWCTASRSSSHSRNKHLFMIPVQGVPTVNSAWQDRHILLSGRILHALRKLYTCCCRPVCATLFPALILCSLISIVFMLFFHVPLWWP